MPNVNCLEPPFHKFLLQLKGSCSQSHVHEDNRAMLVSWQPLVNPSRFTKPPTRMLPRVD